MKRQISLVKFWTWLGRSMKAQSTFTIATGRTASMDTVGLFARIVHAPLVIEACLHGPFWTP